MTAVQAFLAFDDLDSFEECPSGILYTVQGHYMWVSRVLWQVGPRSLKTQANHDMSEFF